jgi:predicted AlkP superfamily phosphohydrolase/phosphomutase
MGELQSRLLVIGLDGGTFDALLPLMERGLMPNLTALRQRGCWGPLASTMPPFTAAAWSTFITGHNPGRHGIISFTTRDRFNYDVAGSGFVNAQRLRRTLWEQIGEAGRRLTVVNVPLTYPARPVAGNLVTGMLTPPSAPFTYPESLAQRLGPAYVVDLDFIRGDDQFRLKDAPEKAEILAQLREMSRQRAAACLELMAEEPWPFFMVVFTGTDRIFHFFWDELQKVLDGRASPFESQLLAYFQELDGYIGALVDGLGPEVKTFIISDHGFGPAPTRRFFANRWLEQMGLLQQRKSEGWLDVEYWRVRVGRNQRLKSFLRRIIPESTQRTVTRASESASKQIVEWSNSRAYFVPVYFHVIGVEINLAGERAAGIVNRGAEYERLRDLIIQEAGRLIDPVTNRPVVRRADRREAFYQGESVTAFPDVIIELDPDYVGAGSLAGRALFEDHDNAMRTGEHREAGIFVAAGPDIVARAEPLPDLRLVDTPATALYALDLAVPKQFDGRVLAEIFEEAYLAAHPPHYEEAQPYSAADGDSSADAVDELSPEQQQELETRLRGLGYLE